MHDAWKVIVTGRDNGGLIFPIMIGSCLDSREGLSTVGEGGVSHHVRDHIKYSFYVNFSTEFSAQTLRKHQKHKKILHLEDADKTSVRIRLS